MNSAVFIYSPVFFLRPPKPEEPPLLNAGRPEDLVLNPLLLKFLVDILVLTLENPTTVKIKIRTVLSHEFPDKVLRTLPSRMRQRHTASPRSLIRDKTRRDLVIYTVYITKSLRVLSRMRLRGLAVCLCLIRDGKVLKTLSGNS